jgi:hypothetical protein
MHIGELIFDWNESHENEEDSIAIIHERTPGASIDISMSQLEGLIRMVNERYPGFSDRVGRS